MTTSPVLPARIAHAYGLPRGGVRPPSMRAETWRAAAGEGAHPAPGARAAASDRVSMLVGGRTGHPVNLDTAFLASPRPAAGGPVLPLYTRAADSIEAATAIMVGRSIDLRG